MFKFSKFIFCLNSHIFTSCMFYEEQLMQAVENITLPYSDQDWVAESTEAILGNASEWTLTIDEK